MQRSLIAIALIPFGVLSAIALWQYGYWGIWATLFRNTASVQVFADLLISLSLVLVWLWHDAKATGRNPWPWLVVTLTTGSFGPLFYLLTRQSEETASSKPQHPALDN